MIRRDRRSRLWQMIRTGLPWGWWIVLLAPFLLLGDALLRGQALFWGTVSLQFVPWWVSAWEYVRQGALPVWNSLNGLGTPLIANYQVAFFYPPNWLLLPAAAVGEAPGVAWMMTLLATLHLSWAGLGMAWFLRRWRFPALAQVMGGLAYGLGGYVIGRLAFLSMAWSYAWVPWILGFALEEIGRRAQQPVRSRRLPVGFIVCLAFQLLTGHAQLSWYTLLLCALWVSFTALERGGKALLAAWGRFLAGGLAAGGLAAVQLLPTAQFLLLSQRAQAYDADALMYSFWPWRFLTILMPDFFGSPVQGSFWGYATYWEDHIYPGLVVVLLAVATLWLLIRKRSGERTTRRRLLLFAWPVLVLTFLFALGKNTLLYPFLFQHVPSFAMFQAPARYLLWAAVLIPVLGAVGIEHWRCPTGRGLYWFRLATAGTFALTLGAALALRLVPNVKATFIRAIELGAGWALVYACLTMALPYFERIDRRKWWESGVVAVLLADLLVACWGLNPTVDRSLYAGKSQLAQEFHQSYPEGRIFLPEADERVLKFDRFLRFEDFRPLEDWCNLRETLLPNLNLLDGLASANNFDPLVTERYARWLAGVNAMPPSRQSAWLARYGVNAVERVDTTMPHGIRFDTVRGAERLWWYGCAQTAADADAAWMLLQAAFVDAPSADRPLILEMEEDTPSTQDCSQVPGASLAVIKETPGELRIQVNAARGGWLVLADSSYPDWHVTIDGASARWFSADVLLRAVYIPSGVHDVHWFYRPLGVAWGGLLSILVLFLLLIYERFV